MPVSTQRAVKADSVID